MWIQLLQSRVYDRLWIKKIKTEQPGNCSAARGAQTGDSSGSVGLIVYGSVRLRVGPVRLLKRHLHRLVFVSKLFALFSNLYVWLFLTLFFSLANTRFLANFSSIGYGMLGLWLSFLFAVGEFQTLEYKTGGLVANILMPNSQTSDDGWHRLDTLQILINDSFRHFWARRRQIQNSNKITKKRRNRRHKLVLRRQKKKQHFKMLFLCCLSL